MPLQKALAATAELYELLLANDIDVAAWALADVADAYLAQRQPRQAEALYRQVLAAPGRADPRRVIATDPRNAGLHADRAEALLSLEPRGSARAALADAQGLDPDHPRVRQARETLALHDRRELDVEGAFGRGETASLYGLSGWPAGVRIGCAPESVSSGAPATGGSPARRMPAKAKSRASWRRCAGSPMITGSSMPRPKA